MVAMNHESPDFQIHSKGSPFHFPLISCAILMVLPLFLSSYGCILMTKILIFAIFAMSLDLIFGYTGLPSLGHAAYLGTAGYVTGILMVRYGVESFWIGATCGVLGAGIVAAAFGFIALRVSGIYFLLVTFALGQLLHSLATKWKWLTTTRGTEGVTGIRPPNLDFLSFTWDSMPFYYFALVIFIASFFILRRIVNSPFGYALRGIRESEHRMRVMGYNIWLYKYIAFVLSGLFAGVAGVLLAYHNGFMVPSSFAVVNSGLVMLMVIIGGTGTLYGPVIGAGIILILEYYASSFFPERWPLFLGLAFVISIMYARAGIFVYLSALFSRVTPHGSLKG